MTLICISNFSNNPPPPPPPRYNTPVQPASITELLSSRSTKLHLFLFVFWLFFSCSLYKKQQFHCWQKSYKTLPPRHQMFYPWVFTEPSPRIFLVLSRSVPGTQKPQTRDQNRSHGGGESVTKVMQVIISLALIICKTKCTFQFLILLSLQTRVDQSIWSVFSSLAIKIHLMHGLKLIDPAWYQIICFYTLLCFFYPRDLKFSFTNSQNKLISIKFSFYAKGGIFNSLMSTEGRAFSVSLNVVINISLSYYH